MVQLAYKYLDKEAYSFMHAQSVSLPKFASRQDSYHRLWGRSFVKNAPIKSLDSLKKEVEFKKFLIYDKESDNKFFYTKYKDIYESEKMKRYKKRYLQDNRRIDEYELKLSSHLNSIKNVFVGTKNYLVKMGIDSYKAKVAHEKEA